MLRYIEAQGLGRALCRPLNEKWAQYNEEERPLYLHKVDFTLKISIPEVAAIAQSITTFLTTRTPDLKPRKNVCKNARHNGLHL